MNLRSLFLHYSIACIFIFSNISYCQNSHTELNSASVFSLKAGFTIPPLADNFIMPFGYDISLNADIPFGKGFYLSPICDLWGGGNKDRKFFGYNIDAILKYRFYVKKFSFGFGIGLGGTNFSANNHNLDMLNFTTQIFADYFLIKSLSVSSEISFYGMGTIDWGGGQGKGNRIIEFKIGISIFQIL